MRFPGPTPLGETIDGQPRYQWNDIGPKPHFRVLYSAPVDLDSVRAHSRLEFNGTACTRDVALVPISERPLSPKDGSPFRDGAGADRDTVGDRFLRVVELVPRDSLWPGCTGRWYVASFDPRRPADQWRYDVHTAPVFRVAEVRPCTMLSR